MSSISLSKFGDNLPVTGIMALSQAAVGFGVGLLIAETMGRHARNRTAIALIGAGAATVIPFAIGIVNQVNNRPESSRRQRQQLESIRESAGVGGDEEAFQG